MSWINLHEGLPIDAGSRAPSAVPYSHIAIFILDISNDERMNEGPLEMIIPWQGI